FGFVDNADGLIVGDARVFLGRGGNEHLTGRNALVAHRMEQREARAHGGLAGATREHDENGLHLPAPIGEAWAIDAAHDAFPEQREIELPVAALRMVQGAEELDSALALAERIIDLAAVEDP